MAFNFRLPHITEGSDREMVMQLKTYMYQMTEQLQWALNTIDSSVSQAAVQSQTRQTVVQTPTSQNPVMPIGDDAESTFNDIKSLIIKSSDIVNAYYEEINKRLKSEYVAQSDFGGYTEEVEQAITENATEIERAFRNIQTIDTDVQSVYESLSNSLNRAEAELSEGIDGVSAALGEQIETITKNIAAILTVNAYIKSGLLYYNDAGLPIYGVEVGQTNNVNGEDVFRKFARFTANRLSFYDQNDMEVAYISDYKLYITSVEILYSLVGGGFMLDFSRGFTLQYLGGE